MEEPSPKRCFILWNDEFERTGSIPGYDDGTERNLAGYRVDYKNIKKTFQSLGFSIKEKHNKNASDMAVIFDDWCNNTDFEDVECVVVFVLTHGGDYGTIFGTDNKPLELEDVLAKFGRKLQNKKGFCLYFVVPGIRNLSPILS